MKFYLVIILIIFNALLSESKLLRSKYLTEQMISDVGELDKYEKKARVILSKYEKAKLRRKSKVKKRTSSSLLGIGNADHRYDGRHSEGNRFITNNDL